MSNMEINFSKSAEEQLINYAAQQIRDEMDKCIIDEMDYRLTGIPSQYRIERTQRSLESAQVELKNYKEYKERGCWPFDRYFSVAECDKAINNYQMEISRCRKYLAKYQIELSKINDNRRKN